MNGRLTVRELIKLLGNFDGDMRVTDSKINLWDDSLEVAWEIRTASDTVLVIRTHEHI
jgi:hypothetical protein